jgi:hypothetical protein
VSGRVRLAVPRNRWLNKPLFRQGFVGEGFQGLGRGSQVRALTLSIPHGAPPLLRRLSVTLGVRYSLGQFLGVQMRQVAFHQNGSDLKRLDPMVDEPAYLPGEHLELRQRLLPNWQEPFRCPPRISGAATADGLGKANGCRHREEPAPDDPRAHPGRSSSPLMAQRDERL